MLGDWMSKTVYKTGYKSDRSSVIIVGFIGGSTLNFLFNV